MEDIRKKHIAIIGVYDRTEKFGFKIFRDLIKAGFNITGVNPRGIEVLDRKTYKGIKDINASIDMIITIVPPGVTEKVVQDAIELGIKQIWMQPGSESPAAIKKAEDAGINVRHNACFMVENGIW